MKSKDKKPYSAKNDPTSAKSKTEMRNKKLMTETEFAKARMNTKFNIIIGLIEHAGISDPAELEKRSEAIVKALRVDYEAKYKAFFDAQFSGLVVV